MVEVEAEKPKVAFPASAPEDDLAEKTNELKMEEIPITPAEAGAEKDIKAVEKAPESTEKVPEPVAIQPQPVEPIIAPTDKISEPAETVQPHQGAVIEPFAYPVTSAKPKAQVELTDEQHKKYDQLFAIIKDWKEVPTKAAANAPKEPLTDGDRLFLTRDCLLRYLRATKWDLSQATKRLMGTLTWRREYGLLGFTHDYISPENETGKQVILGYDHEGRPLLYLNPSKQNTERSPRQLQHLFYNIERVIEVMPPGQESLDLLINFMDTKRGQGASPAQGKETMDVLQNHYPERLGLALVSERMCY